MLMPDSEPPKHLQRAEVDAALVRLVQDAGEMARVRKLARANANGWPAMETDDVLGKRIMVVLEGTRKLRGGLRATVTRNGVTRSVAWR